MRIVIWNIDPDQNAESKPNQRNWAYERRTVAVRFPLRQNAGVSSSADGRLLLSHELPLLARAR